MLRLFLIILLKFGLACAASSSPRTGRGERMRSVFILPILFQTTLRKG
jgi:hypothetical protein